MEIPASTPHNEFSTETVPSCRSWSYCPGDVTVSVQILCDKGDVSSKKYSKPVDRYVSDSSQYEHGGSERSTPSTGRSAF